MSDDSGIKRLKDTRENLIRLEELPILNSRSQKHIDFKVASKLSNIIRSKEQLTSLKNHQ